MTAGTVIQSVALPADNLRSLAWDGSGFWTVENSTNTLYQLDTGGRTIITFPGPGVQPQGVAWDGNDLWVTTFGPADLVYQIDPQTGTIKKSFATPAASPFAIVFNGRYLFLADLNGLVYQIDPITGTVIGSFSYPVGNLPFGMTWDGRSLWIAEGSTAVAWELGPTGAIQSSFALPAGGGQGIEFVGRTMWHIDNGTDLLYQLSVN